MLPAPYEARPRKPTLSKSGQALGFPSTNGVALMKEFLRHPEHPKSVGSEFVKQKIFLGGLRPIQ